MLATLVAIARPTVEATVSASQAAFLSFVAHGGQGTARRNAYRAVLLDESAAAHRRRVSTAVDRATTTSVLFSVPAADERSLGHA